MPSFLHKLWTSSPDRISRAFIGRLTGRHKPIQRPAPEWHRVNAGPFEGCELLLAPSLAAAWREMISGSYEPFMLQSIKEHLDLKGAVVWDVGAHIGFHSLCFAAEVGEQGAVVSFEPTAASHERLQKNIDRNQSFKGRIRAFNMALSDKRGTLSFVYSDGVDIRNTTSHLCDVIPPSEDNKMILIDEENTTVSRAFFLAKPLS